MPFYAVAKGLKTGVFETWPECQQQIVGFKGAVFKKFPTLEEAEQFVQERGTNLVDKRKKTDDTASSNAAKASDSETASSNKRKGEENGDSSKPKKTKLIEAPGSDGSGNKFTVDEDDFLILYTDGACQFNGKRGAQAGVGVYFGPDHPMNVSEPVKGRATNNTAEIQAATYALELTKAAGFSKVKINTDSNFMISCMTSWLPGWKKNNWKKRDGSEVINKEDLIDLDKASDGLLVKWNHVKGHDGIPGNEAADKLARAGAKRYVAPKTETAEEEED